MPAQNSESINHAVKHPANQQGLLKDDDGLVAVLDSTMSVLERGEVDAMKKLERDLQQGLGVSREYTTELTKAIGRVAGIGYNVVGTFTITTTEGDPAVGPCRYVVQHCTVRTHTIVVYYEKTGYTARYSAQELNLGRRPGSTRTRCCYCSRRVGTTCFAMLLRPRVPMPMWAGARRISWRWQSHSHLSLEAYHGA